MSRVFEAFGEEGSRYSRTIVDETPLFNVEIRFPNMGDSTNTIDAHIESDEPFYDEQFKLDLEELVSQHILRNRCKLQ